MPDRRRQLNFILGSHSILSTPEALIITGIVRDSIYGLDDDDRLARALEVVEAFIDSATAIRADLRVLRDCST